MAGIPIEFACKACGSTAVAYPEHLSDDGLIKCRRCAAVLCTVGEFRSYVEGGAVQINVAPDRTAPTG